MPDEQPVEQTDEVTEEVVDAPKVTKKQRGRPKGSKNKKKVEAPEPTPEPTVADNASLALMAKIAEQLGELGGRLDSLEANTVNQPNLITARGPGAPTTAERENIELMSQTPGPARQAQSPAERDKVRRDAIYDARQARGRQDRQEMPSGVVASVGNRQRRSQGATRIINRAQ